MSRGSGPGWRPSAILGRPLHAWRSSVSLRVVATTLALSLLLVGLVGALLISRITNGLLDAKQRTAVVDAANGAGEAQRLLDAADTGPTTASAASLIDTVQQATTRRQGDPALFEWLLLATPPKRGEAPELASRVQESSVPTQLREAVQGDQQQSWTYTEIRYENGTAVPGLAVGSPLAVPGVGSYEIYYLYPLTQEQATLDLVRRTVLLVGTILVLTLGAIAYVVTRQVVSPVRSAARTAERLSAGYLTERMRVRGEDDLARLATSFNGMAANLQEQINRLEALSRVQQRFVSDVSHELRTPLTTVRMAADMMYEQREEFDPATARSAELLQTQLDRFESLLGDLLEISRFDAGAAVLDPDPVDLRGVVERVVDAASPLAERKAPSCGSSCPTRCAWSRPTRGGSTACCATSSSTRSSTARAGPSTSRSRATTTPWPSPCATTVSACDPVSPPWSSTASGAPTRHGPGPPAAPGWACRSRSRTCACTAGGCRRGARPATARTSG